MQKPAVFVIVDLHGGVDAADGLELGHMPGVVRGLHGVFLAGEHLFAQAQNIEALEAGETLTSVAIDIGLRPGSDSSLAGLRVARFDVGCASALKRRSTSRAENIG